MVPVEPFSTKCVVLYQELPVVAVALFCQDRELLTTGNKDIDAHNRVKSRHIRRNKEFAIGNSIYNFVTNAGSEHNTCQDP